MACADGINLPTSSERQRVAVDYETVSVPVLVVGAGAAGARVAIGLAENGVEPLVIGKRDHGDRTDVGSRRIRRLAGRSIPRTWTTTTADTRTQAISSTTQKRSN